MESFNLIYNFRLNNRFDINLKNLFILHYCVIQMFNKKYHVY